jgi:solute carrier family 25 (mitochondrial folate transporter), member 32
MSGEGSNLNAKTPANPSSLPPPLSSEPDPATHHAPLTTKQKAVSKLAIYCTKLPEPTVNSFCGALGGVASGIVTCPLDVIKTRLQAQGSFRHGPRRGTPMLYHGMIGTAKTIWKEDGVRGMYRGLGPMLLGYLPTWAVYMSVYDLSKDYYGAQMPGKSRPSDCVGQRS